MNPKHTAPPPATPGLSPVDIYYILFRHKWLIAIISAVSLVAAILVHFLWRLPYMSEAELLIKYIQEARPQQKSMLDSQISRPDIRGENIVNSEIVILTSMDLAQEVAKEIGPDKIVGKKGAATNDNLLAAAIMVKMGLVIPLDITRGDIIRMTFSHPDFELAPVILSKIIEVYQVRHNAIHHPENNEWVTQEIDRIKAQKDDIDGRLRDMRTTSGIMTIEDSKKTYGDLLSHVQGEINDAEAEEAGYLETIKQMQSVLPAAPVAATATNVATATNAANAAHTATQPAQIPAETTADYQRICSRLATQKEKYTSLLGTYTTNYPDVQNEQKQIDATEGEKAALEKTYPGLIALKPVETHGAPGASKLAADPREALNEEIFKSDALAKKIEFLTNRLAQIEGHGTNIIAMEGPLTQLQTQKSLLESQLVFYQQSLDENRVNSALGNSEFSIVESPTPPTRDMGKLNKLTYGIFLGGLLIAIGLPFLIELYLDRSLKRPMDVQIRLGLPFFISIPQLNGNGAPRSLKGAKKRFLLPGKTAAAVPPAEVEPQPDAPANGHLALWEDRHSLQPFYETLRDRLMTYFEMINLTHKPKLVAVTSCRSGAGVSTTAAGLASSLSETGDGNVLLVNMNVRDGETQHFFKGKLTCGLDEVLEKGTRENACVQGNLYVAKEQPEDDRLPRVLPKRFSHLLPKMKASDFDYIIFDMPPVSHISITPRLARFMDMVLLVVESGKTDRDAAKRAADLLAESKTNIGVVLNKNRSYLPRRLHQDI